MEIQQQQQQQLKEENNCNNIMCVWVREHWCMWWLWIVDAMMMATCWRWRHQTGRWKKRGGYHERWKGVIFHCQSLPPFSLQ
jgi:hypothetical protein